jgi:DNA-binding transcriptional regulator YdaS (Cro superfamily)
MKKRAPRKDGLEQAIAAAGSMTALAIALGVTPQSVAGWDQVPAERCLAVEAATGVPRHVLRPDIYGPHPGPLAMRHSTHAAA